MKIKIQSVIDLITNSSTETFTILMVMQNVLLEIL